MHRPADRLPTCGRMRVSAPTTCGKQRRYGETMQVKIIGAGLAGCEAALWLADRGVQVELYEQKPAKYSPAHKSAGFAELICSNSLKAERPDSASGLLKIEMKMMGSHLLDAAETARVAAGGALASLGSYGIALWAMTRAPVATVAALRETSVLFAALLGTWLLKEQFTPRRALGTCVIVAGVMALRLA